MNNNQIFNKYNSRLVREGVLKSALCGLIACFASIFVIGLTCWACGVDSLGLAIGLSLGIGFGVGIATAFACYFFVFRPTDKDVARRVDSLGFEERMITMLELENDTSYIAMRQREDAKRTLAENGDEKLAYAVSLPLTISTVAVIVLGAAMFIVSVLSALGVIDDGRDIFIDEDEQFFIVSYVVDDGGEIYGESDQIVNPGEDAESVRAVALEGWVFVSWDDGNPDPYRQDFEIREDMIISAIFEEIDSEGEPGEGDLGEAGEKGETGDVDKDANQGGAEGGMDADGDGESGEGGEGDGKGDGENDSKDPDATNGNGQSQGSAGKYDPSNQIINNDTYYRDELENNRQEINDLLSSDDSELTPEEKEFIEKYFGSI